MMNRVRQIIDSMARAAGTKPAALPLLDVGELASMRPEFSDVPRALKKHLVSIGAEIPGLAHVHYLMSHVENNEQHIFASTDGFKNEKFALGRVCLGKDRNQIICADTLFEFRAHEARDAVRRLVNIPQNKKWFAKHLKQQTLEDVDRG